jgi:UDP-N-acetylmuramate--alanine ligase
VEHRENLVKEVQPHIDADSVMLLMGARDPSLEHFAVQVWEELE